MEETLVNGLNNFFLQKNVILTLVVVMCTFVYLMIRRDPRLKYHLDKLGGPPALPVLGNAIQLLRPHNEMVLTFVDWVNEYGVNFRFWVGNWPYLFTSDVHLIEKITSSFNHLDKGIEYKYLHDWLGTGLLTAPGSKSISRRKLLNPSFNFKILEDFLPIFNQQASIMLECIQRDKCDDGKIFNMLPYITKCTLDIICETAMGKKINAQTSAWNKEYVEALDGMCEVILDKMVKPWLRVPLIYNLSSISTKEKHCLRVLKGFTEQVIKARKIEREQDKNSKNKSLSQSLASSSKSEENEGIYGKKRKAFLDLLLDTADETGKLTDADIREEVDTFMFEGQDTTAVSLGWTVLLLAMHPECQKLVQSELDDIFEDDYARDVTTADISKMKYLECCIKESLRLYPSVPLITRDLKTDITLDNGNIIPRGCTLILALYFVHRLGEHFPEPEKFIPDRFSSESISASNAKRHTYAYIPFSAGPRNCIGQKFALMEEKIILAKLFRGYTVETEEKMENLRLIPDLILRCENAVHIRLLKRLI